MTDNQASNTDGPSVVTACVVVIGNEVLSGRTRDANVQMLGGGLANLGIRLNEVRIIRDDIPTIVDTVNMLRRQYDYVFTTGGIGPTHDDLTTEAIAKAFGVAIERHPEAVSRLQRHYQSTDLSEARLKMAGIPVGASLVDNPVSAAPGFRLENVFVMAGIPRIAEAMFAGLKNELVGGAPVYARAVTGWMGESLLADALTAIQGRYPDCDLGSYPFVRDSRFGTTIVARGTDEARLDLALAEVAEAMRRLGADPEFIDHSAG